MCLVTANGDRWTVVGDPDDAIRFQNLSLRFGSNQDAGQSQPLP
jgi:hypothetical protein